MKHYTFKILVLVTLVFSVGVQRVGNHGQAHGYVITTNRPFSISLALSLSLSLSLSGPTSLLNHLSFRLQTTLAWGSLIQVPAPLTRQVVSFVM